MLERGQRTESGASTPVSLQPRAAQLEDSDGWQAHTSRGRGRTDPAQDACRLSLRQERGLGVSAKVAAPKASLRALTWA